ncbi:MAG: hypothetical protein KGY70_06975 [Bacteroidales bacterium]|nr:hypothetical protein [Bacteroidales bacterium]
MDELKQIFWLVVVWHRSQRLDEPKQDSASNAEAVGSDELAGAAGIVYRGNLPVPGFLHFEQIPGAQRHPQRLGLTQHVF